jgi:hypothetical protein
MEVESLQSGIQNLSIGAGVPATSHIKIKRNFEKKAILKQKMRNEQK